MTIENLIKLIESELNTLDSLTVSESNILKYIKNFRSGIDRKCCHSIAYQYRKPKDLITSCMKCEEIYE